MTNDEDLQGKVNQKLADATSQIIDQAHAKDHEEAYRLLRAWGVSHGIGLLIVGTGAIGLAVLFHASFPRATPIILAIAFVFWIVGALLVDVPNWRRTRLARRLLNRSSNR